MDKLEKSRQLLSTAILKNFVGRITGAGLDRIVGSNPENVLLVGKLMSTNDADGQNANSSKTFIKSIGVDFYISESDLDNAVIRLFPQGDFYYRAIPTLEEQRMAMLREINDSHDYNAFDSFEDVAAAYKINPANFSNYQIKLIPVYKKIRHAYYREYCELQSLCLLILQHQKHQIGMGSKKVYGLLFDGAWLWEEYMNSIVDEIFYHPMNKATKGSQRLFDHNRGLIYPDFISRDSEARVIADAKYKPIDNIGNKDYLQVLAYMFRFDAKKGFYFYPEMGEEEDAVMWLNRGSTYEKNVEAREDICLIKHGFQIPTGIDEYSAFTEQMRCNEIKFLDGILTSVK